MISYEDLIKEEASKVRNTPALMDAYIHHFKALFGYEPNCASCTFSNDWNKFINATNQPKTMSNLQTDKKSFKLRDELAIYTYIKTLENGVKIPVRTYGYTMSEDFARKYLTIGTPEQLKDREKQFKILPKIDESNDNNDNNDNSDDLSNMSFKQLQEFATERGFPQDDWKSLKSKEKLSAYLEANMLTEKE